MGSYTSEIITAVMINEGAKVLDTVTTLMGLPDLASDGSPLFGNVEDNSCQISIL